VNVLHNCDIHPKFKELFQGTLGLDPGEYGIILESFEFRTLSKNEFFLRAGQTCRAKAYVNKGCLRSFVIDDKGHERIMFFPMEDWWAGDFESYYSQQPGTNYIQALEDCELFVITKQAFDTLENQIPKLKQWYNVKMIPAVSASRKRLEDLKTLTPEERYLQLIEKQPTIVQRVSLKHIASYLNIEPPSLSRMRKRLSQKP